MKQRQKNIDVVKAIAVMGVVLRHCGGPHSGFFDLFMLAVFFIVSGYFYKGEYAKTTGNVREFIGKKIKGLWMPYAIADIIWVVLNNLFIKMNVYTDNILILNHGTDSTVHTYMSLWDICRQVFLSLLFLGDSQLGGAMWFFRVLFSVSILYCILDMTINRITANENVKMMVQIIISAVFLLIGWGWSIWGMPLYIVGQTFSCYWLYHFGRLLQKKQLRELSLRWRAVIGIVSWGVLYACYGHGRVVPVLNEYKDPLFFLIVSVAGWEFLWSVSCFLCRMEKIRDVFALIGENTGAIVILHFLCFKMINAIQVRVYSEPSYMAASFPVLHNDSFWWIVYFVVGIAIPIVLNVERKKITSYLKMRIVDNRVRV